ncbi:AAA family ATPase [Candidatus Micrarchaeota archaeon]|nr:AAA family ATPase [Candidatus Micrarchaeota archaeon]
MVRGLVDRESFVVGKPVSGELFYGRKDVIETVVNSPGNSHALVGIRRVGKTSILEELELRFRKKGVIALRVNIHDVIPFSIENFLNAYTTAVIDGYATVSKRKQLAERIKEFLKGKLAGVSDLIKSAHIETDAVRMWFEFRQGTQKDLTQLMQDVIAYPEKLAREAGSRVVIMIDEFQELQKLGEDFMKSLRSNMQKTKKVDYVISGSSVGMMSYILGNPRSPFYNMFLAKRVGGLDDESARRLLGRLKDFGVSLKGNLEKEIIVRTVAMPLYLQAIGKISLLYCHEKETKSKRGCIINKEEFDTVIWRRLFGELYFHFEQLESYLHGKSRTISEVIAVRKVHAPSQIAREAGMNLTSLPLYLKQLINEGFLEKREGGYYFTDPVFEEWFVRKKTIS